MSRLANELVVGWNSRRKEEGKGARVNAGWIVEVAERICMQCSWSLGSRCNLEDLLGR